jgi:hypothetical protein
VSGTKAEEGWLIKDIHQECRIDLDQDRILAAADKLFDFKMLFDLFEKEFHRPALSI